MFVASRCEDPKLIRLFVVINLELVQPVRSRYINVTERQTDGRTDGRLTIAIPCFVLYVHRAVKTFQFMKLCKVDTRVR